jgi:probable rRNA maturation factor
VDEGSRTPPAEGGVPDTVVLTDEQTHPVDGLRLRHLAAFVLADQAVPPSMELSLALVDTPAMTALNREHMGADGPTDVLAFPMDAPDDPRPEVLGDVVLCPEVAAAQAADGVDAEIDMLLVHGILHLLGHDHVDRAERDAMFGLTDRLLGAYRGTAP